MANYPTNDPTDGSLHTQVNNLSSILENSITAADITLTLSDSSSFPGTGFITLDTEAIEYTGNATATGILSGLTRGADSTTAAVHDAGVVGYANVVAAHHNRNKDEIIAIGADLRDSFGQIYSATNMNTAFQLLNNYTQTTASNVAFTTSTEYADLLSIPLGIGVWKISLFGECFANGATVSLVNFAILTQSGNTTAGIVVGRNRTQFSGPATTAVSNCNSIPDYIVDLSATTTYYFKYSATYSGGPPSAYGTFNAIRLK